MFLLSYGQQIFSYLLYVNENNQLKAVSGVS